MNLSEATYVMNLMWYDGPWIDLYKLGDTRYITKAHEDYLDGKLFEYERSLTLEEHHRVDARWLIIELTKETDDAYFAGTMSLLEVIQKAPNLYIGGYHHAGKGAPDVQPVSLADIRPDSLPSADSFHLDGHGHVEYSEPVSIQDMPQEFRDAVRKGLDDGSLVIMG